MNPVISAVGMTAAAVGVCCSTPQVWRLWRSPDADGVSHASAILGVLAATTWLSYGVTLHDVPQIMANIPGLAGAVAILVLVVLRSAATARPAVLAAACWVVVLAVGYRLAGPQGLGVTATSVTLVARGPQVWTAYRSSSLSALSPLSFALTVVSASLWVVYGIGTRDAPVWTSAVTGLTMSVLILGRVRYLTTRSEVRPAPATPAAVPATAAPAAVLAPAAVSAPAGPATLIARSGLPLPPTPRSGVPIAAA